MSRVEGDTGRVRLIQLGKMQIYDARDVKTRDKLPEEANCIFS